MAAAKPPRGRNVPKKRATIASQVGAEQYAALCDKLLGYPKLGTLGSRNSGNAVPGITTNFCVARDAGGGNWSVRIDERVDEALADPTNTNLTAAEKNTVATITAGAVEE